MKAIREHKRWLILIPIMAVLMIFPAVTFAQEVGDDESPLTCDHPVVSALVLAVAIDCLDLLDFLDAGYGLGQVMQAAYLAEGSDSKEAVQGWLDKKDEGIGWGQMKLAQRLADANFSAEEMLELKQNNGLGWGQIKKIQAFVEDGTIAKEDVPSISSEDLAELGPPPWAGGGKDKDKGNNGNGPPPHSNAGGNNKTQEDAGDD